MKLEKEIGERKIIKVTRIARIIATTLLLAITITVSFYSSQRHLEIINFLANKKALRATQGC